MKLFKPQVQLAKQTIDENNIEYFIHVVTFFDRTFYRNDGNAELQDPDSEGNLNVELWVKQDENLPNFKYLTPVVHSFSLGVLPSNVELTNVSVQVMIEELLEDGGNREAGEETPKRPAGKTNTTGADLDEDSRPIGGLF